MNDASKDVPVSLVASVAGRDDSSFEVTQKFQVRQVPDDAKEYYIRFRISTLKRCREQLGILENAGFPYGELCLAIASITLGAALGAWAGGVKLEAKFTSGFFYIALPCIAVGTFILYVFLRHSSVVDAKKIAKNVLGDLPLIDSHTEPNQDFSKIATSMQDDASTLGTVEKPISTFEITEPAADKGGFDFSDPKVSWNQFDFNTAYFLQINQESGKADLVDQVFQQSPLAEDPHEVLKWSGWKLYCKLEYGMSGQFDALEVLAKDNPGIHDFAAHLGRIYRKYGDNKQAAVWFECAADSCQIKAVSLRLLGDAAEASLISGQKDRANSLANRIREYQANDSDLDRIKLTIERRLLEIGKDDERSIGILERLLELDPTDDNLRFLLGFKYSEMNRHALAALHYGRIDIRKRGGSSWNNLGVALYHIGIPSLSIEAFLASSAHGETLAASNLANQLIPAGFLQQAEDLLDKASITKPYDNAVDTSRSTLNERKSESLKKLEESNKKVTFISDFYKRFGESIVLPHPPIQNGIFEGPEFSVTVSINGDQFLAHGKYVVQANKLLGIVFPAGAQPIPISYEVTIRGNLLGSTMVGNIKKIVVERPPVAPTLLDVQNGTPLLLILSPDGNSLHAMEIEPEVSPSIFSFVRHP
ncbi:tetratricopeptide repeat protein [Glaciimonas soli]|uniref:Tetratricopeptide repeat protein n=1 Tax=Glaciimonas soli TaxID=2590999 RepID=A0A843YM92_9BURK|nr:hypothetical protein [Glaciimonas soli]MQQ99076.1 hypothetical protein [Glaciimonas soli]